MIIKQTLPHLGDAIMALRMMEIMYKQTGEPVTWAGTPGTNALFLHHPAVATTPVEHIMHWDIDLSDMYYAGWGEYAEAFGVDWDGKPPKLIVTSEEVEQHKLPDTGRMKIGVCTNSRDKHRCYPHHKALVKKLKKHYDVHVFGREQLPIRQLVSKVSQLDKLITVDTGVAHLGGCLGVPIIIIAGHDNRCRELYGWYRNTQIVSSGIKCPEQDCLKCKHASCIYCIYPNTITRTISSLKGIILDLYTGNSNRGLGDILMSTVVARALQDSFELPVTYIVRPSTEVLITGFDYVHDVKDIPRLKDYLYIPFGYAFEDYSNIRNCRNRIDSMLVYCGVDTDDKTPHLSFNSNSRWYVCWGGKPNLGMSFLSASPTRSYPLDMADKLVSLLQPSFDIHYFSVNGETIHGANNHKLSLPELLNAVSQMDIICCTDSFMSHLAGALDIQSVVLYTTIQSDWRNKYYNSVGVQSPIDCSPCRDLQFSIPSLCAESDIKPCIASMTPELISEALLKMLPNLQQ